MARYKSYNERTKPARCLAKCVYCGRENEKRYMQALMLRENAWATPKVITFMCTECVCNLFEHLEIKE